jgi:hypothetical protein
MRWTPQQCTRATRSSWHRGAHGSARSAAFLAFALAITLGRTDAAATTCAPYVEEQARWSSASFRAHRDGLTTCTVSEETYRAVVQAWLAARGSDAAPLTSLSLGRAVDFPWLSHAIADAALASPGWVSRAADAKPGRRSALAAPILRAAALRARLAAPFEGSSYVVTNVVYEKVLFGKASEHATHVPPGDGDVMVPFDAQLWLRLAPRKSTTGETSDAPRGAPAVAPSPARR